MPLIELEFEPPRATLWLNRPEVANAINAGMLAELHQALGRLQQQDDLRVLLIRGRGGRFCAGADLGQLQAGPQGALSRVDAELATVLDALASLPLVVVGVLERCALGGGFLLALCCDQRIATPGTRLGFSRHWVPPCGLSRLAAWIGPGRAQQLLVVRPELTADDAQRIGLVDYLIAPEKLPALLDHLGAELAGVRPDVIREVRDFFTQYNGQLHQHWDKISSAAFERTFAHPQAQQAVRAFLQSKRPPS
jgi:enoyl-CoA hydratase/carnithine racemase